MCKRKERIEGRKIREEKMLNWPWTEEKPAEASVVDMSLIDAKCVSLAQWLTSEASVPHFYGITASFPSWLSNKKEFSVRWFVWPTATQTTTGDTFSTQLESSTLNLWRVLNDDNYWNNWTSLWGLIKYFWYEQNWTESVSPALCNCHFFASIIWPPPRDVWAQLWIQKWIAKLSEIIYIYVL